MNPCVPAEFHENVLEPVDDALELDASDSDVEAEGDTSTNTVILASSANKTSSHKNRESVPNTYCCTSSLLTLCFRHTDNTSEASYQKRLISSAAHAVSRLASHALQCDAETRVNSDPVQSPVQRRLLSLCERLALVRRPTPPVRPSKLSTISLFVLASHLPNPRHPATVLATFALPIVDDPWCTV
ncbi:hypothetical protein PHET_08607 [Paragonimus heterotremus]|uniref:Uncharacterized protein n=1 Tax=Paragonimus heterotremus TaxID=100268 RepID=A0A8J4WPG4_9TREM|nr:hypothetical protein PHET_08607 [Paragonimus heterotremus]